MINDIITIYFINQRYPSVTCNCDEEHSAGMWYGLLYRHPIKIGQSVVPFITAGLRKWRNVAAHPHSSSADVAGKEVFVLLLPAQLPPSAMPISPFFISLYLFFANRLEHKCNEAAYISFGQQP